MMRAILIVVVAAVLCVGCRSTPPAEDLARVSKAAEPMVAVQLYVFMQDRARRGVDAWTDLDAIFAEARSGGAETIEGWLDWFSTPERAERVRGLLAKHELILVGAYSNARLHEQTKVEETLVAMIEQARRAQAAGVQFIDINPDPLPGGTLKSDEQLAVQAAALNELGRRLAEMQLTLVVHFHAPEMQQNAREHRYHLAHTDPRWVWFCVDVHWILRGGQDPMALLAESLPRTRALHLRNSVNGVWSETLGPGDIDYAAVARMLKDAHYDGWLVLELAHEPATVITRPVAENIRAGLAYLVATFGLAQ